MAQERELWKTHWGMIFAMIAEWALGRHTRRDPLGAFEKIKFPFGRDIGAWIMPWIRWVVPAFVLLLFFLSLIKVLQDSGRIPQIIPVVTMPVFHPVGITLSTVVMMVLICSIVWGGFIFMTHRVITVEREKKRRQKQ